MRASQPQEVIVFDPEKCTGCTYCMIACTFKHYRSTDFDRSCIRIVEDPENPKVRFIAIHCAHCDDPYCIAACPVDAIVKDNEEGLVRINSSRCIGCMACQIACPISNPRFDGERKVAVKCDFCDGDPQCVKFCTTGALQKIRREEAREKFSMLRGK
ncbi:MAG: 4Fe-4S dicluster domain-containing protein [Candidatus Bathyarchaeia archaeon]